MSAAMGFVLGTQERVRSSRGKRAIGPLKFYCMCLVLADDVHCYEPGVTRKN